MTRTWKQSREKMGLPHLRVHDLKHTFGRRLRAAGISAEDRADLLGHKTKRITTHYSASELRNLLNATNKVCSRTESTPILMRVNTLGINNVIPFKSSKYIKNDRSNGIILNIK